MEQIKYKGDIIKLYTSTLTNYLKYMKPVIITGKESPSRQLLIYSGWKSILQVLSMMYLVNMNVDQLEVYMERSYVLFNEYVEKIYTTDFGEMHNPTMFVQKVLIGNISLNAYQSTNKTSDCDTTYFVTKLAKWSELILAWNNKYTNVDDRLYLNNTFSLPLLTLFLDEKYYHTYRILETLQSSFDAKIYSERHALLITALHTHFTKSECVLTQDDVQNIMFCVFFRDRDVLEEKFMQSTTILDMNHLVSWIFSKEYNVI